MTYLSDLLVEKFGYKLNTGPKPNGRPAGGHSPGDFQATDGRLDVDALLAAMPPSGAGADEAQPRVLLALAQQGFHPGDIVEKVVAATMDMAARNRLGWDREIELRCVHSRFQAQPESPARRIRPFYRNHSLLAARRLPRSLGCGTGRW